MSDVKSLMPGKDENEPKAGPSASEPRRETFPTQDRNRSSSRGNGRVEKRIEATLPHAEQPVNARSRKSSHVLGLFKENSSSKNIKTQDKIPTDVTARNERSPQPAENALTTGQEAERSYPPPIDEIVDDPVKPLRSESAVALDVTGDQWAAIETNKDPQEQARKSSIGTGSDLIREDNAGQRESREGKTVSPSTEGSCEDKSQGEYKEIHAGNLSDLESSAFQGSARLQSEPGTYGSGESGTGLNFKGQSKVDQYQKDFLEDQKDDFGLGVTTGSGAVVGDEEDSDKEQISSALYYPHEAPSPDAQQEDFNISPEENDEGKEKIERAELGPLPSPALRIDAQSEDVDIALQSYNKSRYLHGDLPKSWLPPSGEAHKKAVDMGASSISGSEYEDDDEPTSSINGEDSSHTDEPETTPIATPVAKSSFLRPRDGHSLRPTTAPIRAVELKPYNHQVGGHSTVFRFSKRAVCKQLSNRENEFYEVVEREHPELLKFLPRYVPYVSVNHPLW